MVQVALAFGAVNAATLYALVLKHTTWQPTSQYISSVISWLVFFLASWLAFDIANPYLIRAFAYDELERETTSFAEDVVSKLLMYQPVDFTLQDDLIKNEAIKSVESVLVDQVY